MTQESTCASCGQPLRETPEIRKKDFVLCSICTLNGTTEPKFETIVYKTVINSSRGKKQSKDDAELLEHTKKEIAQLPYWQGKFHSTPTLAKLIDAKEIITYATKLESLEIDESLFNPPDFFISHKWHDQCDKEIVEPLVKGLKKRGYQVWYDKITWEREGGKKDEWMKRGITQARHCIAIFCQDYFTSEACRYELETMLATKDPKFIHPIWWTDIDLEFLRQDELGKKTLTIKNIDWEKGDNVTFVIQLIELANQVEGLHDYNGVSLIADEARMLKELEKRIKEKVPLLEKNSLNEEMIALLMTIPSFKKEIEELEHLAKELGPSGTLVMKEFEESIRRSPSGFYAEENRIITLVLKEKGLKSLPSTIGQCLALRMLDLADNDLRTLPESFSNLENLERLNLRGNQLKALPPSFRTTHKHLRPQYPAVVEAEATVLALLELLIGKPVPQVTKMEWNTFGFTVTDNHVTGLGLYDRGLRSLPEILGNLKSLQRLELSKNQLKSLPETFSNLTNLVKLSLHINLKLNSLPENFGNLKNLEQLDLGRNELVSLPDSFGNLRNLKSLTLISNRLSSLPDNFGNLKNLQWLNLRESHLQTLPENFGQLENLTNLYLDRNQLTSLPENFGNLKNLKELHLDRNQLQTLPENFGNLTGLEKLRLYDNQLQTLPESFGNLRNLQRLELQKNRLSSLPQSFGSLIQLDFLNLNHNQLQTLPESFGNLKKLLDLHLHDNQLSSLPESFGQLSNLQKLDLHSNQLSSLPEAFENLTNLKILSLWDSFLHKDQRSPLPQSLVRLTNLRTLYLCLSHYEASLPVIQKLKEQHCQVSTRGLLAQYPLPIRVN